MATVLPSAFGTILTGLQQQLTLLTGLDSSRIVITLLPVEDTPYFGAEQDVLIRPGSERPNVPAIDGAGRMNNLRYRQVHVTARSRVNLDRTQEDAVRLTDQARGLMALEDLIVDALEYWSYTDASGNDLSLPARVGQLTEPRRHRGKQGTTDGWCYSTFTVEIEYRRALAPVFWR